MKKAFLRLSLCFSERAITGMIDPQTPAKIDQTLVIEKKAAVDVVTGSAIIVVVVVKAFTT
jgi:hypothetical protein